MEQVAGGDGPGQLTGVDARVDPVGRLVVGRAGGTVGDGDQPELATLAAARLADDVAAGHAGLGEEHFVERGMTVHLADRSGFHPGLLHRQHEVGDPEMLGDVPIGAGEQHPVVGVVGARAPQLLPADDPLVPVPLGPRREPGEIGPAPRLAEQLAPRHVPGDRDRQQGPFQVGGRVGQQCRGGKAHARARRWAGSTDGGELLGDDGVGRRRQTAAEPLGRPRRRRPAAVEQPPAPLLQRQLRVPVGGDPGADLQAIGVRVHREHGLLEERPQRGVELVGVGDRVGRGPPRRS